MARPSATRTPNERRRRHRDPRDRRGRTRDRDRAVRCDLYTAYTFVAVPAAVFATGALPYTIVVYRTYSSGLRAPALIAVVKDILIHLVIIVAGSERVPEPVPQRP